MSRGFQPSLCVNARDRQRQIEKEFGECVTADVTAFVSGISGDLPEFLPCGCGLGRTITKQCERAREEYAKNEEQGKKLFAILGQFALGHDGPLAVLTLDDGTVVTIISPVVAATNPTMTITNGKVEIHSVSKIDDSLKRPGQAVNNLVRMAESAINKRNGMQLVEAVSGGASLNISTLRTFDYTVVHPLGQCRNQKGDPLVAVGRPGVSSKSEGGIRPLNGQREPRRRVHRFEYEKNCRSGQRSENDRQGS